MIRSCGRVIRAWVNSPRLHAAIAGPWCRRPRPGPPRSVLVFQTNHIGDYVLGTTLLVALHEAWPNAALHVAVTPGLAELARSCPFVSRVITLPPELAFWGPAAQAHPRRLARLAGIAIRRLRVLRPDVALVPRVDSDASGNALLALFSGAARRVGFAESSSSSRAETNAGFDAYFTDVVALRGAVHEVRASREMALSLGFAPRDWAPTVWHSAEDARKVAVLLDGVDPSRDRLLVFAPGATAAFRRWPAASFAELGRAAFAAGNATHIAIVGSAADRGSASSIKGDLPAGLCHDFTGALSLPETVALLRKAYLFVGNDSGPLHLAAAAGVPCLEISSFPSDGDPTHANSPVRFGPWGVPHRVLQPATARSPCHGACSATLPHCILDVQPESAISAMAELLTLTQSPATSLPTSQ